MTPAEAFVHHHITNADRTRPVTGSTLADLAYTEGVKIRHRDVPEIVHKLVTERGIPIVSGPSGYWLARTPNELEDSIRYIKSKHLAHHERVNRLMELKRVMIMEQTGRNQMGLF